MAFCADGGRLLIIPVSNTGPTGEQTQAITFIRFSLLPLIVKVTRSRKSPEQEGQAFLKIKVSGALSQSLEEKRRKVFSQEVKVR